MNYRQPGNSCPVNELDCNPAESIMRPDRSLFRVGDALLEAAISVTAVRVAHADTEQELDEAFAELIERRNQREYSSAWATAEAARAQLRVDIDNRIQDLLHQQMDAERVPGK